jgi:hypothetical protein
MKTQTLIWLFGGAVAAWLAWRWYRRKQAATPTTGAGTGFTPSYGEGMLGQAPGTSREETATEAGVKRPGAGRKTTLYQTGADPDTGPTFELAEFVSHRAPPAKKRQEPAASPVKGRQQTARLAGIPVFSAAMGFGGS